MENDSQDSGVWVIIPASGVGSRMQSDTPKQYLSVRGKTILEHTISRFIAHPEIAGILVVVGEQDHYWEALRQGLKDNASKSDMLPLHSTIGGSERSETVLNGLAFLLQTLNLKAPQWVIVHDAARPCLHTSDLNKLLAIRSNSDTDGGILATQVKDTLKKANSNNSVVETQPRDGMWQAQTPQLFRLGELVKSLEEAKQAGITITDEASAMEYNNKRVHLVEGSSDNIKLTTPADLRLIGFLLKDFE